MPSQREDCLFCDIVRDGAYVARTDGFVAINDINPQAETHILIIPERHVDTFRDVAEFEADEVKRMLDFIAEVARRRRPDRLPGDRERRPQRRADDLPSPLARDRRHEEPSRGGEPGGGERAVSLIVQIEGEVTAATLARDTVRRDALRLILSSLRSAEKELQRPLSNDEELQVLQRERKKRQEAAVAFREGGREERAAGEEAELAILEEFMPEPISEEELERIVDDAIAENGATSLRDMGRVMADVMPQVAGRADGSAVGQVVREKLA